MTIHFQDSLQEPPLFILGRMRSDPTPRSTALRLALLLWGTWILALNSPFWASASGANDQRPILIYPTQGRVLYSGEPESNARIQCTMSLNESQRATLLERRGDHIRVRFAPNTLRGCVWDQIWGRDINEGWLNVGQVTYADDESAPSPGQPEAAPRIGPAPRPTSTPCPETTRPLGLQPGIDQMGQFLTALREQHAGMKSMPEIEQYLRCYPLGQDHYSQYRFVMRQLPELFSLDTREQHYMVNQHLMTCLFRRESGFDTRQVSQTNAVGLGQHTSINIRHINDRLQARGSWERRLWDRFFDRMRETPEGRRMIEACPRTARGQAPRFESREDAVCPLNSIAAASIYNLQVQRALRRASRIRDLDWSDELTYQLAIGATYNLGDGLASRAVDDLSIEGWLESIRRRSPNPGKQTEVAGHIQALRNCMQVDNWRPPHPNDPPRCELPRAASEREPARAATRATPRPAAPRATPARATPPRPR